MKILFTGHYDPEYNRTVVIKSGLVDQGIEVIERPLKKKKTFPADILKIGNKCDAIFLPSFTHGDVRKVKRNFPNKKVIFDPLISKYLTKVFDYKSVYRWSPRALKNWWKDKSAMTAADLVLADTEAHRQYFHDTFNIPIDKIKVLYIGVDTKLFFPKKGLNFEKSVGTNGVFKIGFYGSFAPLQGIDVIVEAAHLLKNKKNVQFEIVGGGFVENEIKYLAQRLNLTNIIFTPTVAYKSLNDKINEWDICLGIFGKSKKARLVIPNKIYHYAACAKPIITMRSEAIKELFVDAESIILCESNPTSLAEHLHETINSELCGEVGANGYRLISKKYDAANIAAKLIHWL